MHRRRKLRIGSRAKREECENPDRDTVTAPATPGTVLVLPDARGSASTRARRGAILLGCFLAGGALGTAAYPWVETALARAVDEVRALTEAGFTHSADRTAIRTPPEIARP